MTPLDTLVTMVSWEERFSLGLEKVLSERLIGRVLLLRYEEYISRTERALAHAHLICRQRQVPVELIDLSYSQPTNTWPKMRERIRSLRGSVLIDITTMTREAILTTLFFLNNNPSRIEYVYYKPGNYGKWLSRDPAKPRLLLQMSGEVEFGKKTVLLVTTGFDCDRTEQLIRTFEPVTTLLAFQGGEQFGNPTQNIANHADLCRRYSSKVEVLHVDAYVEDHGRAVLAAGLSPYWSKANIVMSSLGPKLSAVALYKIYQEHPSVALAYAPAGEYSELYSSGIGDQCHGVLQP